MTKTWKEKRQDEALSKNHSKSVKFRLRVQQDQEAKEELREQLELFEKEHDEHRTDER
jgi:hypothetical protein